MLVVFAISAICLSAPVNGPVISGYSPAGPYAGHWGLDFAAVVGEPVAAPVSGRVTFAGSVAGMRSVTIEPVPRLKVSLSYLSTIEVSTGDWVTRGQTVGRAGTPHGVPGVHISTRINGSYVDPATQMGCRDTDISRALRLVTPPRPNPRPRANRSSRRRTLGSCPTPRSSTEPGWSVRRSGSR